MTFIGPTARSLRLPVEDFDLLIDRLDGRRHQLRGEWFHEPAEPIVVLRIDLAEARHLQERLGEQSCPAMKAISRAFGVPPRTWRAYGGTPPGCGGIGAAHNTDHPTY